MVGRNAKSGSRALIMFQIIGIVLLFGLVFGSYLISGGKMDVILHAAPHEMMAIGGAGIAAFLISNSMTSKGVIALESHIENPHESTIFARYPKIGKDHFAIDFICDTLRMMTMNLEDPHQVEDAMEKQVEKHHHEALAPAHALQQMADALPALGIVAAVLGVIKTMGSITEPPEILGGMIGGALVGTFLGVFLAYGLVGPMSTRLKEIVDEEGAFYKIIQAVLVAHLHGNAAQISVEIGRGNVPGSSQPSFNELEQALTSIPAEAA
jgi:chemotaxis protein MotA